MKTFLDHELKFFNSNHSGVRECEGNRYQACVLDVIGKDDQDKRTDFVICAMDFNRNPQNCAKNLGLDANKISICYDGERGTQLQLEAEEYSREIIAASGFVPTIVYNRKYKAGEFWESLEDFENVASNKIKSL